MHYGRSNPWMTAWLSEVAEWLSTNSNADPQNTG